MGRRRCKRLQQGVVVAYRASAGVRRCRVGKSLCLTWAERLVALPVNLTATDGRRRVTWEPSFWGSDGDQVRGAGEEPIKETKPLSYVLVVIDLLNGVMSHAAARRLDRAGWRVEEGAVCPGEVATSAVIAPSAARRLEALARAPQ